MPPQIPPHPTMRQSPYFMQHPQAAVMAQQQGFFPLKMPLQFGSPHQVQDPQQSLQQQQPIQSQMGMRPVDPGNALHPLNAKSLGGGSGAPPPSSGLSDVRAGSKQDASNAGIADGCGSARTGRHGSDGEQS